MVAFSSPFSILTSALLATLFSSFTVVQAAPWPHTAKHSTHRTRHIGRQLKVETYNPQSSFKAFGADGATVTPPTSLDALKEGAMSFMATQGFDGDKLVWKAGFTSGETGHAYMKQAYNGIPFANAVCNVAIAGGKVASWGSSFVDLSKAKIADPNPTVTWRSVLPQIEDQLDAKYNDQNATLEYFVKSDGTIALTHIIQTQNQDTGAWYEAYIDAHSGDLVSITDFVSHATYTVVPVTKTDFSQGLETLTDPQDLASSPLGWHSIAEGAESTTTSGNNVIAFRLNQVGVETSDGQNFNAEYDDNLAPSDALNAEASKTNAFYIINTMHDVTYKYGFTETAFNFQQNNLGKGGVGRDRVLISVQDASGVNNANFATPPDGQPGQCRMFVWNFNNPNRDGALENDIIIHEFTHGVTNRMTGGGTGRCLQTTESGGLGEGWGDAMANWVAQSSATTEDFAVAKYVFNAKGLRSNPYSTNARTNPLRYSSLKTRTDVHDIGEVWANMLHNVYAALVDALGFSPDKLTNPDGPEGNVVFMRLFMDALPIQPCNPTFVQARDAWIEADRVRFNGANRCLLFKAFASRGLGLNADSSFNDDTAVPPEC